MCGERGTRNKDRVRKKVKQKRRWLNRFGHRHAERD